MRGPGLGADGGLEAESGEDRPEAVDAHVRHRAAAELIPAAKTVWV